MVDTEVVEPELVNGKPDPCCHPFAHVLRRVADSHHPIAEHPPDRLGHQPRGVGEVNEEGLWRALCDHLCDVCHRGHRAQPEGDAPGTGRFLADHAGVHRDPLVVHPSFDTADADGAVHHVGALERIAQVAGRAVRHSVPVLGVDSVQYLADTLQARGIGIVQHHAVEAGSVRGFDQRSIDCGSAEAAGADERKLHGG